MIKLEKNSQVTVVVNFSPRTTLAQPYYLIQVFNTNDEVVETYAPSDLSVATERYNEFEITTTLSQGEYYYTAWESATINPTISDVVGDPIKHGIVVVSSSEDIESDIYL